MSNLLEDKQQETWADLSLAEQKQILTRLMIALEENAVLLSDTFTQETNYPVVKNNIRKCSPPTSSRVRGSSRKFKRRTENGGQRKVGVMSALRSAPLRRRAVPRPKGTEAGGPGGLPVASIVPSSVSSSTWPPSRIY